MDGARLANALATTGESLADVTWRAGVDALSFGFVKNGGLNAEALILFRTELADEIAVRRKRAGHLLRRAAISPRRSWRCSRTTCGSTMPAPPMPRRGSSPAPRRTGWSIRSKRTRCSSKSAPTRRSVCARGLRLLRLGPGRDPARHQLGPAGRGARPARFGDRGAVSETAGSDVPDGRPSVHHLHRDLGIDLDRDPGPARRRAAAMVGHLPLRRSRPRRWRQSRGGKAKT